MATKFENATTWLQGVVSGYQKQINDFSAVPNPDANKIKACKEQLEQLELVLGLDATISFCRAALILELPEFGSKEALLGTLKDFAAKQS